jgi:ABC-type lipoprotein release transport system permease subunit
MPVLLTIGVRQVLRQRRRSLATLIAIAVSVAAVMMTRGFIDGVQRLIKENVVLGSTGAVVVHKAGFSENVRKSPLADVLAGAAAFGEGLGANQVRIGGVKPFDIFADQRAVH